MDISRKNGRSGMTLIEILIVVGLLGVLASVLIRSLSGTSEAGKQAAARLFCETTLKTILMAYRTAKGGWPADKTALNTANFTDADTWKNPWDVADGYNFALAAGTQNLNIWTKFRGADAGAAATGITDDNVGALYTLKPSGELTKDK